MCIKKWAFLITMTLLFLFTYTANADETCLSPYMAKITGHEDFVYVWTLSAYALYDIEPPKAASAAQGRQQEN